CVTCLSALSAATTRPRCRHTSSDSCTPNPADRRGPRRRVIHSFFAMDPARKVPTIEDLEALPPGIKGEIIEGVLYTMTRPRGPHRSIGTGIGGDLRGPFDRGRGGPGGWWILVEPGIELANTPEISPDVAGFRRERLPQLPSDAPIRIVPDWVC